ncbi:MAG: hypothetical protein K6F09_00810 [Clostridiales bacterium]|nr:hypothetical protein [Clostridiales bacterium]
MGSGRENKILRIIVIAISSVAVFFGIMFGIHYVFDNPFHIALPGDMKAFTVVSGGDMSPSHLASNIRGMEHQKMPYMQISDRAYCAMAENTYDILNEMMSDNGYTYIGYDGKAKNIRWFYKDGYARSVRVEFDTNEIWSVWNLSKLMKYDLKTEGYKTMQ